MAKHVLDPEVAAREGRGAKKGGCQEVVDKVLRVLGIPIAASDMPRKKKKKVKFRKVSEGKPGPKGRLEVQIPQVVEICGNYSELHKRVTQLTL